MIGSLGSTSFSQAALRIGGFSQSGAVAQPASAAPAREDLAGVLRQTTQLRKTLEALKASLRAGTAEPVAAVPAGGNTIAGVGAPLTSRTATLRSAEVNAEPGSFARGVHGFEGASTSAVTLSGQYTGPSDDTLSFRALRSGTVGQDDIVLELRNAAGETLKFFTLRAADGPDAAYEFDNGLVARFGAGTVVSRDTLDFDVSATTGGAPDPSRAFSDMGGLAVGFEDGQRVTAGAFSVNGVSIAVGADDSMNSVLARITASAAGVDASYDAQTEQVTLTRRSGGLAPIVLGADSSGFLAATRLTEGTHGLHTTLTTAEVNQAGSSFGPTRPAFSGASTAEARVGGSYGGARDETLTFTATRSGFVGGLVPLQFEVRDGGGALIDTLDFPLLAPAGTTRTLANGLEFSLGSGTVVSGDSFEVEVAATVGGALDPAAAFDGGPDQGPRFEGGQAVTAGSFEVNGVTIAVAANDSVDSVLAKISASAAGVTAGYDSRTETIQLTRTARGDEPITLGGDTSGFLAATRLSSATQALGEAAGAGDIDEAIGALGAFAGISSGSLQVGGRAVAVDVGVDSIRDVIARINASGADVMASISESGGLRVESTVPGRQVELDDGGTGFFATVGVTTSWEGAEAKPGGRSVSARKAAEAFADMTVALNELLRGSAQPQNVQDNAPRALRDDFRSFISGALSGLSRTDSRKIGLRFDADLASKAPLAMSAQDLNRLESTLRKDPRAVLSLFVKASEDHANGLLETMLERARIGEKRLAELVGSKGQNLSVTG